MLLVSPFLNFETLGSEIQRHRRDVRRFALIIFLHVIEHCAKPGYVLFYSLNGEADAVTVSLHAQFLPIPQASD